MKTNIAFYKKFTLALLACSMLLVNSCQEDLLSPTPQTSLAQAEAFANADRIQTQINGLYAAIKSGQFYGGRFVVYGDIRGEEFLNETTNAVTGLQTWNHTLVSTTAEVNNLWNSAYYAINSCNLFIAGLQANADILNNPTLVNNFLAEARFVRAVCYFSLASLYCRPFADGNGSKLGLVLRLQPESGAGNNDLARSTVAQTYTQILEDLNFAEQNLPNNYSSALLNTTRAHKNTAIAYKTRVYMAMQRYADVITEANKLVPAAAPYRAATGVAHELQADVTRVFASPYTTTESIFSMPFTDNNLPGTQNGLGSYYNPGPRGIGDYSLNPNGILANTGWKAEDARRKFAVVNTSNRKPYLAKFPTGPNHTDYVPVIRYAEVMLNLAEAITRTSGVNQRAIDLLNAVRRRSDPTTTFTTADFANAEALANAILLERRIEFLGEGLRSLDCMRLLAPIPGKANVATINPSSADYIWKFPQGELNVNKLAVPE